MLCEWHVWNVGFSFSIPQCILEFNLSKFKISVRMFKSRSLKCHTYDKETSDTTCQIDTVKWIRNVRKKIKNNSRTSVMQKSCSKCQVRMSRREYEMTSKWQINVNDCLALARCQKVTVKFRPFRANFFTRSQSRINPRIAESAIIF